MADMLTTAPYQKKNYHPCLIVSISAIDMLSLEHTMLLDQTLQM